MPILNSVWKRVCGHRLENVSPLEVNLIIAGPIAAMINLLVGLFVNLSISSTF